MTKFAEPNCISNAVSSGLSCLSEFTITNPVLVYNTSEHTFQKKMHKKLLKEAIIITLEINICTTSSVGRAADS